MPLIALALSLLYLPLSRRLFDLLLGGPVAAPDSLAGHCALLALVSGWLLWLLPLYLIPWVRQRRFPRWTLLALLLPCGMALVAHLAPAYWLLPIDPADYSGASVDYIMAELSLSRWQRALELSVIPSSLLTCALLAAHFALSRTRTSAPESAPR